MLKILQARPQQYMNHEHPDVQAGFRKGRGTRDQIANIRWIIEKAREFQKNIYFSFIDYAKAFDCVDHKKLWKILQEMGIRDHLTCLLRNLYSGQEATVRTEHKTTSYLRLLIFLPAILIPACASSRPAFLMTYSAYKLNKQGDNIQPQCTSFPIWNQSVVPCPVLTVAS